MNERRKHCRVSGAMIADTIVRVRPGYDGDLVNLSPGGALVELRRPLAPGVRVDVQLSRGEASVALRALVLRCSVRAIAALDGVTYQAALLFEQPFDLGRASGAPNGYQLPTNPLGVAVAVGSQLPGSQEPAPSPLLESPK